MAKPKVKQPKTIKVVNKNTIIKAIQQEELASGHWVHRDTRPGSPYSDGGLDGRLIKQSTCPVCAVGAVVRSIGCTPNSITREMQLADVDVQLDRKYFKLLVDGGCYLTSLSDMFEGECSQRNLAGWDHTDNLRMLNELIDAKSVRGTKKKLSYDNRYTDEHLYPDEELNNRIASVKNSIKNYNKEMRKVKAKLVRFVKSNFPNRVPIRKETKGMKAKALKNQYYSDGTSIKD